MGVTGERDLTEPTDPALSLTRHNVCARIPSDPLPPLQYAALGEFPHRTLAPRGYLEAEAKIRRLADLINSHASP